MSNIYIYIYHTDLEAFLTEVLKGENLSKRAKEKRDAFIKRIKEVKAWYEIIYLLYGM